MNENVKADDLVEVTGTGNNVFIKEGVKKTVHRIVAEKLVASGAVSIGDEVTSPKRSKGKKDKLEM